MPSDAAPVAARQEGFAGAMGKRPRGERMLAAGDAGRRQQEDLRQPPYAREMRQDRHPIPSKRPDRSSGADKRPRVNSVRPHDNYQDGVRPCKVETWTEPSTQPAPHLRLPGSAAAPVTVLSPEAPLLLEDDDDSDDAVLLQRSSQPSRPRMGDTLLPGSINAQHTQHGVGAPGRLHVVEESDDAPMTVDDGDERGWQPGALLGGPAAALRQAPTAGHGSIAECLQGGLTADELAAAERLCREEQLMFPRGVQLDVLASAAGVEYDSLLDACKVFTRGCVFCTRVHPKTKGQCQRISDMMAAGQGKRWQKISTKRCNIKSKRWDK